MPAGNRQCDKRIFASLPFHAFSPKAINSDGAAVVFFPSGWDNNNFLRKFMQITQIYARSKGIGPDTGKCFISK